MRVKFYNHVKNKVESFEVNTYRNISSLYLTLKDMFTDKNLAVELTIITTLGTHKTVIGTYYELNRLIPLLHHYAWGDNEFDMNLK